MKKMKGVAASVEYSPYPIYEDQRNRFKHHSLMQDFDDLFKETEAMRKRVQVLKDKKLTLLVEVRFLKGRHKFLMQNRTSNTPAEQSFAHSQNKVIRSKPNTEEKKSTGKEHTLDRLATGFDLNQKVKTKETTLANPSPMFDLNQKQQKVFSEKEEVTLRTRLQALDSYQKERPYSEKEATARSMAPTEEEELQANNNSMGVEELKRSSLRIGSDEQHNDIKLSACWNTGNGPNRVGKRKITWQDQVALKDLVIPRASLEKPRRSIGSYSYSKLPEEPIKLSIRKLDGSSFDVEVIKSATIADLKLAVQHVFSHMPKKGPGKISWMVIRSISSSTSTLACEQNGEEDEDEDDMEAGRCKSGNDKKQSMIVQQECQFGQLWRSWSSHSKTSTIRRKGSSQGRVCQPRDGTSFPPRFFPYLLSNEKLPAAPSIFVHEMGLSSMPRLLFNFWLSALSKVQQGRTNGILDSDLAKYQESG
ncbi:U11/U12 small nuclear ribonucleoprotein 25 kDa [Gossypium australe]|uniref:U11/U12 small nuclear ribonucleoprotein 25 kDa n=1 Tax=Gossypium australe TaxID=47621 RepID=A0A5B6VGQ6_9ROSI|nr:U11/U12 small nuclear ribonucleoprotein 25 kDa [Gossypium australe]